MHPSPFPGMYGLWSFARESWHPDPILSDGTPLMFDNVMDAIRSAATYSTAFRLVPARFNQRGGPSSLDLSLLGDQCPACRGTGEVEAPGDTRDCCAMCDGTGSIESC